MAMQLETTSQIISNQRANRLKERIQDYTLTKNTIQTGYDTTSIQHLTKQKILTLYNATESNWNDWHWQLENRITDVHTLNQIIKLTDLEKEAITQVSQQFRWGISPYYVSLMDPKDPQCPVRLQAIPSGLEMTASGETDPMGEEFTSPVEGITRRYPDRLIIKVTNQCAMFCRHCQRRRAIGQTDLATPKAILQNCIEYVRANEEVRDVLLTGGDALCISDETLKWLLEELKAIPHVDIIRIGSRTLVTMPQRITPELCEILEANHPIYMNTHFNSPSEITPDVAKATHKLCKAGVPLGNQAVCLKH